MNGYYFQAYANLQTRHYGLSLYLFFLHLLPLQRYPTLISDSSSTLYRLYVQLLRDRFLQGRGFYFTALLFALLFSVMTFQFLDVIWLLGDFYRSFFICYNSGEQHLNKNRWKSPPLSGGEISDSTRVLVCSSDYCMWPLEMLYCCFRCSGPWRRYPDVRSTHC
jgi:hypothetical protein